MITGAIIMLVGVVVGYALRAGAEPNKESE